MSPLWEPSIYCTNEEQSVAPSPNALHDLLHAFDDGDKHLQMHPYDAKLWIERASYMLSLNYPELAAGVAYRAGLLLDRASDDGEYTCSEARHANMRLGAYQILGQALYDCHCHWEAADLWKEVAMKNLSDDAEVKAAHLTQLLVRKKRAAAALGRAEQEQKDMIRDGGVLTVDYPWIEKHRLTRSRQLVAIINDDLSNDNSEQTCFVGPSTLATGYDMLGMFAARRIAPGECILVDRTAIASCSNAESTNCDNCYGSILGDLTYASCCRVFYCSRDCRDLAMETYHHALCGQDFTWLTEPAKGLHQNASPLRPLLMLRILAICVQAGAMHNPIDHPLIARLQPLANRGHLDVFTLNESIISPVRILEQLGVDVFANRNFDTAILHTIWVRAANNKGGSTDPLRGFVDEITPHMPLFNHSCEPNVKWSRVGDSTTVRIFANQRIEKGEELFSSYLDVRDLSLADRLEQLRPWFEGPCLCQRCKREAFYSVLS